MAGSGLPTHFKQEVRTSDDGNRTLVTTFLVNVRQTLLPDFEAAAHDTVLRQAHAAGHMPVGPILILTEAWTPPPSQPLKEGEGVSLHSLDEYALRAAGLAGDIVQVTADVDLGLSL